MRSLVKMLSGFPTVSLVILVDIHYEGFLA